MSLFPVDREDLEAEAVLALLHTVENVDLERIDLGKRVVKGTASQLWAYATKARQEVPVADVAATEAVRDVTARTALGEESTGRWELNVTPLGGADGLAVDLRFTESATRREGARLGGLAASLGLRDVVFRARRGSGGARIGTLTLRPAGAKR